MINMGSINVAQMTEKQNDLLRQERYLLQIMNVPEVVRNNAVQYERLYSNCL